MTMAEKKLCTSTVECKGWKGIMEGEGERDRGGGGADEDGEFKEGLQFRRRR